MFLLSQHDGKGPQRSRDFGTKTFGGRRQVKMVAIVLSEDTYAGERPKNAVERVRMRSRDCRQRGRGLRAGNEQIGKPELGGHIDRLGYPRAGCQIE